MFWDSSALVPTILPARDSEMLLALARSDDRPTMWWASPAECQSAIYRHHRDTPLPSTALEAALRRLDDLVEDTDIVAPTPTLSLRARAGRLLSLHALRAADAVQLAAALIWCEDAPRGEGFVCLDARLRDAARAEGFGILPG
jgi:predicted nucleic acid-binding protein